VGGGCSLPCWCCSTRGRSRPADLALERPAGAGPACCPSRLDRSALRPLPAPVARVHPPAVVSAVVVEVSLSRRFVSSFERNLRSWPRRIWRWRRSLRRFLLGGTVLKLCTCRIAMPLVVSPTLGSYPSGARLLSWWRLDVLGWPRLALLFDHGGGTPVTSPQTRLSDALRLCRDGSSCASDGFHEFHCLLPRSACGVVSLRSCSLAVGVRSSR
jgi:hypothetical protein